MDRRLSADPLMFRALRSPQATASLKSSLVRISPRDGSKASSPACRSSSQVASGKVKLVRWDDGDLFPEFDAVAEESRRRTRLARPALTGYPVCTAAVLAELAILIMPPGEQASTLDRWVSCDGACHKETQVPLRLTYGATWARNEHYDRTCPFGGNVGQTPPRDGGA